MGRVVGVVLSPAGSIGGALFRLGLGSGEPIRFGGCAGIMMSVIFLSILSSVPTPFRPFVPFGGLKGPPWDGTAKSGVLSRIVSHVGQ